jgi:N utilization substance protein A
MKGSRVQAVVQELQGEKIDIIPWSEDLATFVVNALQPATVSRVVIDEEESRIEVVVPDDQLSLAIGRRGQNVRLASQLTGWDIDILTDTEESERRQKEFTERTQMFMEKLDCDELIAQLLATEGFSSVEEVAFVDPAEIAQIEGFTEESAQAIQAQAQEHLARVEAERDRRRRDLGVTDELAQVAGVTSAMLVAFGENGLKTVEDLADCSTDDLIGWTERKKEKDAEPVRHKGFLEGLEVGRAEAEELILSARITAGWISAEDLATPEPEAEEGEAEGEATDEAGDNAATAQA